jgi:hypothetical protein
LAVSESGLPAWNLRKKTFTAGKMPAVRDRLEAYPPDVERMWASRKLLGNHAMADHTHPILADLPEDRSLPVTIFSNSFMEDANLISQS